MSDPISRFITRAAYGVTQLPRVAWYVGHSLAVRRLSASAQRRDGKRARPAAHTNLSVPDRRRLYADMAVLLRQDLANVEAGYYPLPADHDGSLMTLLYRSRLFSMTFPRSIDGETQVHTTKFYPWSPPGSDLATICRISISSRAVG